MHQHVKELAAMLGLAGVAGCGGVPLPRHEYREPAERTVPRPETLAGRYDPDPVALEERAERDRLLDDFERGATGPKPWRPRWRPSDPTFRGTISLSDALILAVRVAFGRFLPIVYML